MQQETRSIRNALKMQVGTPERRSSIIGDVFSFFFHLSFFDFLLGRSRTKALEQLIKIYFLIFNTFLRKRENYLKYIFFVIGCSNYFQVYNECNYFAKIFCITLIIFY
jgi:hypothetical protein